MNNRLKRWELALMVGVVGALLWSGWTGRTQRELSDSVIRLHVIANSDSERDQTLKLAVRDRVLPERRPSTPRGRPGRRLARPWRPIWMSWPPRDNRWWWRRGWTTRSPPS